MTESMCVAITYGIRKRGTQEWWMYGDRKNPMWIICWGNFTAHLKMTQTKSTISKVHPWSSQLVPGLSGFCLERLHLLPVFWHTGFCFPAKPATVRVIQWWDKFRHRNRDFTCFQLKELPCKSCGRYLCGSAEYYGSNCYTRFTLVTAI